MQMVDLRRHVEAWQFQTKKNYISSSETWINAGTGGWMLHLSESIGGISFINK
jgi:hypothetical protein